MTSVTRHSPYFFDLTMVVDKKIAPARAGDGSSVADSGDVAAREDAVEKNLGITETGEYIDDARRAEKIQWGRIRLERDGTMLDPSSALGSIDVFWPVATQAEAFAKLRDNKSPGARIGARYYAATIVNGRVKLRPVPIASAPADLPVDIE